MRLCFASIEQPVNQSSEVHRPNYVQMIRGTAVVRRWMWYPVVVGRAVAAQKTTVAETSRSTTRQPPQSLWIVVASNKDRRSIVKQTSYICVGGS